MGIPSNLSLNKKKLFIINGGFKVKLEDTSTYVKMFIFPHLCPNCSKMNNFVYDDIRDETVCRNCGLVIMGPPVHGIHYPIGFKIIIKEDGLVLRELI